MLTRAQFDAIRERASLATPGPWKVDEDLHPRSQDSTQKNETGQSPRGLVVVVLSEGATVSSNPFVLVTRTDAEFVAHAREDVPLLLAEVERLTLAIVNRTMTTCVAGGDFYDHGLTTQEEANKKIFEAERERNAATARADSAEADSIRFAERIGHLDSKMTSICKERDALAAKLKKSEEDRALVGAPDAVHLLMQERNDSLSLAKEAGIEAKTMREQRDALAAALAEVRERASVIAYVKAWADTLEAYKPTGDEVRTAARLADQLRTALDAIPANLAVERDRRLLREAAAEAEKNTAEHGWEDSTCPLSGMEAQEVADWLRDRALNL
mgnify:CR=1 FL=1